MHNHRCKCGAQLTAHQAERYYSDDRVCYSCRAAAEEAESRERERIESEYRREASNDRARRLLGC